MIKQHLVRLLAWCRRLTVKNAWQILAVTLLTLTLAMSVMTVVHYRQTVQQIKSGKQPAEPAGDKATLTHQKRFEQIQDRYFKADGSLRKADAPIKPADLVQVEEIKNAMTEQDQADLVQKANFFLLAGKMHNQYLELWETPEKALKPTVTPGAVYALNTESGETLDKLRALDSENQFIDHMHQRLTTLGQDAQKVEIILNLAGSYFTMQGSNWLVKNGYQPNQREELQNQLATLTYRWPVMLTISDLVDASADQAMQNGQFAQQAAQIEARNEAKRQVEAAKKAKAKEAEDKKDKSSKDKQKSEKDDKKNDRDDQDKDKDKAPEDEGKRDEADKGEKPEANTPKPSPEKEKPAEAETRKETAQAGSTRAT